MENVSLVELVQQSGLQEVKQNEIAESLNRFFNEASKWNETIATIVITDPSEVGKMKMAREGRLTLKNYRLEAEKIVKSKRDDVKIKMADFTLEDKLWLRAGQMMEATFKNLESKLEEKEKFAERWETEQKAKLKAERLEKLSSVCDTPNIYPLDSMSEDSFNDLFNGLDLAKKQKIEAEIAKQKKIEEERLSEQKRLEEQRLENERLKKEAEQKEAELQAEREKARIESERLAKIQEEAIKQEREKAKLEAERIAKIQEEERKKQEAIIQSERLAKQKAEAELRIKQEEENAKLIKQQELEKAPIKIKLSNWIDSIEIGTSPIDNEITKDIINKFNGFKDWAKKQVNNI